jgi:hypothetical protein
MFGKSCLIIGGSVLIREVDFRMFGKSCLIIVVIRQLLPNILKSSPLIRKDPLLKGNSYQTSQSPPLLSGQRGGL